MHKKSRLKILVLAHSNSIGGAEIALRGLIDSTRDEYEWGIVYPTGSGQEDETSKLVDRSYNISLPWWCYENNDGLNFNRKLLLKNIDHLKRIAKEYDVLITNTITIPWLAYTAGQLNKPHIWYVHEYGNIDHGLTFGLGYNDTLKYIDAHSSIVMTISENLKKHLTKKISSQKIRIIHQAIELDNFTSIKPNKLHGRVSDLTIAMVAAIKPSKGQHLLIDSILRLSAKELPTPHVVIRGPIADQEYYKTLQFKAKKSKSIDLAAGTVSTENVLKNADVVFVGSSNEALGRATLEGMAAHRLVMGVNSGATKELLSENRGILFNINNHDTLDKHINNLPELLKSVDVIRSSRFVSSLYNAHTQANEFRKIVNQAILLIPQYPKDSEVNIINLYTDSPVITKFYRCIRIMAGRLKRRILSA